MSADLPKPVAGRSACSASDEENHLYWWVQSLVDCDETQMTEPEYLFTESQLREYAEAKCAELRAVVAQMAEALNYARDEIANLQAHFDPITFPHQYAVGKIDDALSACQSLGEQSAREPRQ